MWPPLLTLANTVYRISVYMALFRLFPGSGNDDECSEVSVYSLERNPCIKFSAPTASSNRIK